MWGGGCGGELRRVGERYSFWNFNFCLKSQILSLARITVNCFPWNDRPTSFICKKILFQVKTVFHQKSSPFSSQVEYPHSALPWGHPHALVWRMLYILLPHSLHRMLKKHVLKGQNLTVLIIWTPSSRKSIKEPGMFFPCKCAVVKKAGASRARPSFTLSLQFYHHCFCTISANVNQHSVQKATSILEYRENSFDRKTPSESYCTRL